MTDAITVSVDVLAPLEHVWRCWTEPTHVVAWNAASDDWCCPEAHNDLRVGGRFRYVMAARDGTARFDFEGTYTDIEPGGLIRYVMDDGRAVVVSFERSATGTRVVEVFDPENVHPAEMQAAGWQAILDRFASWAASQYAA
jgi:uncharacterized protein YndB with AHSA1/START domain